MHLSKVIDCLSRNLDGLRKDCLRETLRVAEYQSDDYHLDRSLFLACQNDRQNLCAKVKSGDGRVYSCLMAQKMVSHSLCKVLSEYCTKILLPIFPPIHFNPLIVTLTFSILRCRRRARPS